MLDPKFIRENADIVKKALKNRSDKPELVDKFLKIDQARRDLLQEVEALKCEKNEASKKIGELIKQKKDAESAKKKVNKISEKISKLDNALSETEKEFRTILDMIPNVPHESVPVGKSEKDNRHVRDWGKIPKMSFTPRDHIELGKLNGILDFERAAKITGSGFPLFVGDGARLERALINFMIDVHVKEHGYKEISPSVLANRKSMRGTGQLPKLEEDMYNIEEDDLFLIPTAEVPLTNLHADEVVKEESLPIYYTASTACFRREAGSYGKDTRGLIRVHQFDKVEMVKFTHPDESMKELETLLRNAEDILKKLALPYHVLELCTSDISFAAHKCYDIELWAPGSKRWLEVSSCSVFSDFQARRANIRYQAKNKKQKPKYVHTLNASGVALPRLVIALLEIYQTKDGSITIPEALKPYFGADKITPNPDSNSYPNCTS